MKSLFFLFVFAGFLAHVDLSDIRKSYPNASDSNAAAKEFALKLAGVNNTSDKTLLAYKGASITLLAKFAKKPIEKIAKFKEGAKLIEVALKDEPTNVEIRLIRLSVQENVPDIVKYKKNIKEDVTFLLANCNHAPSSVKPYIKAFIAQSKSFTDKEKQSIK